MENDYKTRFSLEERKERFEKIHSKYPDRIPVILEQSKHSDLPPLKECKFLLPKDLTIAKLSHMLRRRIDLSAEKAVFIFVNGTLYGMETLMSVIYEQQKDKDDGHLYVLYSSESTFGSGRW